MCEWVCSPGGGGDLVPTILRCVCSKVKDMGPFFSFKGVK